MIHEAKQILRKYFGYSSFRIGQDEIIQSILDKSDTLAIMPTSAGKSLCYQLPSLLMPGITLVISPLVSLMKDQVDFLNKIDIPTTSINGSLSQIQVTTKIFDAVTDNVKILYISPERIDSIQFRTLIKTVNISIIAIDEAHCISQWGHDFRPSYIEIPKFIDEFKNRPIVCAFTATATINVKNDIIKLLKLNSPNVFVSGFNRDNLFFDVLKDIDKKQFLLNYLKNKRRFSGIIYASTRKEVDNLYEFLTENGFLVGKYHAGLTDKEKSISQEDFVFDNIPLIIATNAFGMGINKSNVRFVIHYNMPKNIEAYYQEVGRAGRDGLKSECILLFNSSDVILQKYFIDQSDLTPEKKRLEFEKLFKMLGYSKLNSCYRKYILNYFSEENVSDFCNDCGFCCGKFENIDISIESQKIISCIKRTGEKFGVDMIANVLYGSKNPKISNYKFDSISTYGIMKNLSVSEISDIIRYLISEEYIIMTNTKFPILKLSQISYDILKGKKSVIKKIRKTIEVLKTEDKLLKDLKKLRKTLSIRENIPPYIIFNDLTVKELSEKLPTDKDQFLNITGVDTSKFEKYGEHFIDIIKKYIDVNNIDTIL